MEKDDEVKNVAGSSLDFGARMYDSRLVRWLGIDPLFKNYPFSSPYCFALDNPILFKDYDGRDIVIKNNGQEFTFSKGNTTYYGSNAFITETVKALNHLMTYEAESNVQYKVVTKLANDASVKDVFVTEVPINKHPASVGSAEWNPKQGTFVKDAKTGNISGQNPAGTLLHELGHQYQDKYGTLSVKLPKYPSAEEIFDYMARGEDSPYDNFDEEGVITKVENPYYQYQGQATRSDHDSYGFYEVTGDFNSNTECTSCGVSINPTQTEVEIK